MFLHILGSGSMFTKAFYCMLAENFKKEDHCFLGHFPQVDEYRKMNGCKIVQSRSIWMPIYLNRADHILVHGLFNKTVILALALQPWLLKKCNWIVFGADIYSYKKKNKNLSDKIFEKLKLIIAPRIAYISTFTEGDWKLAKEWYHVKGINLKVSYPLASCNAELINDLYSQKKEHKSVNILVGNSATVTNQHFQALDWLSFLKNEDIQIYLPLNYGLEDYKTYANKVILYAQKIFGDKKVIPLVDKLSGEDYLRFLNTIDVALFNNNRQQAMGNITQAVLCGAKVYIRKDTNMWEHYQKLNCFLENIEEIKNYKTLEDLTKRNEEKILRNQKAMAIRQNIRLKIEIWDNIFKCMEKSNARRK